MRYCVCTVHTIGGGHALLLCEVDMTLLYEVVDQPAVGSLAVELIVEGEEVGGHGPCVGLPWLERDDASTGGQPTDVHSSWTGDLQVRVNHSHQSSEFITFIRMSFHYTFAFVLIADNVSNLVLFSSAEDEMVVRHSPAACHQYVFGRPVDADHLTRHNVYPGAQR